jgi:hypothetical protein
MIVNVKKLIDGKMVTYDHFERVFAKAIFKGALVNIAWGMSKGEFSDDLLPVPLRLKIA